MGWDRIRGHDEPRRHLQSAYARGRLGHAYLFVGPAGVGKRMFAQEFAQALLCERPPAVLSACDRCQACALVRAGTHPDFHTATKPEDKLELPLETVRELCLELGQRAIRGGRKIALLDDADDFNEESANSFLKTLEEPPPDAILVLIATTPDRLLATIRSRCQVVRFWPLSDPDLRSILASHGTTDPATAAKIIRLAGGSATRALALNDPDLWDFRLKLLAEMASPRPDVVNLAKNWWQFTEAAGKESAPQRERASAIIHLVVEALRTSLRLAVGGRAIDRNDEAILQDVAATHGVAGISSALEACITAENYIDRRVQLVLLIEQLADKICHRAVA